MEWTRGRIVAFLAALTPLAAQAADDIGNVQYWLELRPRYNRIEETGFDEVSRGGTARLVAGFRVEPFSGLRLAVEGIHTPHWGPGNFNDDPSKFATSEYPLLPDPVYTGINQAYFELTGMPDVRVRLGQLKVALDNRRWVSENDFRQIPQLFDGGDMIFTGIADVELSAGYYRRIRDTSGHTDEVKLTTLHAAWNPIPGHSLAAYGYFHDQPQTSNFTGFANNSYKAYGLRAEGTAARFGSIEIPYEAEVAKQQAYSGGDPRIDVRYWRVGAGAASANWLLRADYEVRGSNHGQYGLQMPLTDFYGFNGWTLVWFTVPRQGLRDTWITGRWRIAPITLYAEQHSFRSDYGGLDLGRETDASAAWEILPNATLRLQYARYDSGSSQPDSFIRKTWLTLTYTYP